MPKIRQEDKRPLRLKQLGKIYRLVEQFDEISRIDLSKLSRFAPATITALTRILIDEKFLIEKEVQNTECRGRPAVGLCVSPFYWQSLCAMLVDNRFELILTKLDGSKIRHAVYPLNPQDIHYLDKVLIQHLQHFLRDIEQELEHLMTFSIVVRGEIDGKTDRVLKLGRYELNLDLKALFSPYFDAPVLVTEYFKSWLLAESTLGKAIHCDNVIFLQIDDVIDFNVLMKGELLTHQNRAPSQIDKMIVPKLHPMQDLIFPDLDPVQAYQLRNQVSHEAICELVDRFYPNHGLSDCGQKIAFLCERANLRDETAVNILYHIADSLAYILMNLVHIFASEKVMITSGFLRAKEIFLSRLNSQLKNNLELAYNPVYSRVEVITGKYEWNCPIVAGAAIKQGIYDGRLLANFIHE